jgi:hypothetical protein
MLIRFLSLVCLLSGCAVFSPENRMERLCKNNPALCDYEKIDTQIVVREYTPLDTQKVTNKIDSFIIEKDKVITRIYRNYDTIIVQQEQQPDTTRTIIKERSQIVERAPKWFFYVLGSLVFITLLLFLIAFKK